jgi:hypothetical protein
MNYERTILELLDRIQTLEEQVAVLMGEKSNDINKEENTMSTQEIREYIQQLKNTAKSQEKTTLTLRSGDIHKDLNLKNCMPPVCNAMYQMMLDGDKILHTTPSGKSSTIEIQYFL